MVTQFKAGIFKPKAFRVEAIEPHTIEEVFSTIDWHATTQAKYDALINNSTWDLVPLPPNRKAIGCKWLFKVKKNLDGTIAHQKAQLVAKGCSQVLGYDFKEMFSPVVKPATIRVILSIAVSKGWQLRQVNVNNAFLNGDLADEVFMQQPPGHVQCGSNGKPLNCRLKKALYRLHQAPRVWFDKLKCFLLSVGFVISKFDASLFVRITTNSTLYVLVYMDDIIIIGSMSNCINIFVQQLNDEISLKDMGDLYYFLGIENVHTPMVSSPTLSKDDGDHLRDPTKYKTLAIGYADVNWGLNFDYRRSTTGYVYFATSDITWLVSLLKELQLQSANTPNIWCDNSSAVAITANPILHSKFKHVELDLFFVLEKIADGSVIIGEVPTCNQVADILTKLLSVFA
ncbi:hypothetical protein CXB51_021380 [Gossypium anomalum]|uniref:Reverse transcriptase Ty1/copia-type domain-containing protein n=1 Tax=Gossypium anomalum TaxID=47600 RepID=A0A8J6CUL8_9ROSI|nr:hypothetical protein CXB51_021380 [Gossypium anomalum]